MHIGKGLVGAAAMGIAATALSVIAAAQTDSATPDLATSLAAPETSLEAVTAPTDPAARPPWVAAQIDAAIARQPTLAGARIAIMAQRSDGTVLYERDAHAPYNLASNTKLITSLAALTVLGPSYRFTTAVYAKSYDAAAGTIEALYLKGGGDPTLSEDDLRDLAKQLAARGVRSVRKVYWDDTWFDDADSPPHFDEDPRERASFRALTSALSVNGNVVRVDAIAGRGATAQLELHPPTLGAITIKDASVIVGSDRRSALAVVAEPKPANAPTATELTIRGSLARGDGIVSARRRIEQPAKVAAECFVYFLRKHGINSPAPTGRMVAPPNLALIANHASAPLASVLTAVGKYSSNFVAEMLFKATGAGAPVQGQPGPATWAGAQQTALGVLGTLGIDTADLRVDNGSGLYGASAVSAAQLVAVIRVASRSLAVAPEFVASLAIGGRDGTLASRFITSPVRGLVRAKTGTLDEVSTLAGIVGADAQAPVLFAIFLNDMPPTARSAARQLQDEVVAVLFAASR